MQNNHDYILLYNLEFQQPKSVLKKKKTNI